MSAKPNMILVEKVLTIKSPIATVFRFLSNHENYLRWFPRVVALESVDGLPHGTVGKIYQETLRMPTGRNRTIDIEVVESQSPGLFVMEGVLPPLHPRTEIRLLAKSRDETVLNWTFYSRSQSAIGRFLIRALIKKAVVRQSETGFRKLKHILEQESP